MLSVSVLQRAFSLSHSVTLAADSRDVQQQQQQLHGVLLRVLTLAAELAPLSQASPAAASLIRMAGRRHSADQTHVHCGLTSLVSCCTLPTAGSAAQSSTGLP